MYSQETVKTSQKANEVINSLPNNKEWALPISKTEKIPLKWIERKSSFSTKEGIRTFVGYYNNSFIATLSISSSKVSGNAVWKEEEINIKTSSDGYLIINKEDTSHHECGACSGGLCNTEKLEELEKSLSINPSLPDYILPDVILSDGVLRIYRLAMPVSEYYYSTWFNSNIDDVKNFWAQIETYLNEIYTRDLSVKFEIVNDEKLIITSADKDPFAGKTAYQIININTSFINSLIDKNDYDLGIAITGSKSRGIAGLAGLASAYESQLKANAMATASPSTIGHEIGHLFGSKHTFTVGGQYTYSTEVDRGQSLMSYGKHLDRSFFSLVSIQRIWKILSKIPYYSNIERTKLAPGTGSVSNFPYGIKSNNTSPIINTYKLKDNYTIPKNTFFQFYIPAKDKENHELFYRAHPADIIGLNETSNAKFLTFKPTIKNNITFQTTYGKTNFVELPYSTPKDTGKFTFWLGVSDYNKQDANHSSLHNMFVTKVNIIDGTPFKIKSGIKKKYKGGEKVTLTWDVDNNIFDPNSKVRILMSDDFGETFKYILEPSTENDGKHEITIPNITLGRIVHHEHNGIPIFSSGKGLIKIEVLDHIAHDLSNYNPKNGGFEIEASAITFHNLPEPSITADKNTVPEKANVTATTTCQNKDVDIKYIENKTNTLITRTWTATDLCGNTASFTQYIYLEEEKPLSFIGNLPKDIQLKCNDHIPSAPTNITAKGGCSVPKVTYSEVRIDGACRYVLKRTWTATADCANPITHTQYITVVDDEAPIFNKPLPQDITITNENTLPYKEYLSATDNCSKAYTDNHIEDEKVYDNQGKLIKVIRKWKTEDDCNNIRFHTQTISIGTPQNPPINNPLKFVGDLPQNQIVSCTKDIPSVPTLTATGNCHPPVSYNQTQRNNGCEVIITRTWAASCGTESISHTQTITVRDNIAPAFTSKLPQDKVVDEGQIPPQETLTAKDNCSTNVVVTPSKEELINNGNLEKVIYKWVATDDCGNKTEHTQTITIKKKGTPPTTPIQFVGTLPSDQNYSCLKDIPTAPTINAMGVCNPVVNYSENRTGNNCHLVITRTWTASDKCGSTPITHTQTITVKDDVTPSFIGNLPKDMFVDNEQEIPSQLTLIAQDNCSNNISVLPSKEEIRKGNKLEKVIYKWTASDECGNTTEHIQNIIIKGMVDKIFPPTLYPNPVGEAFYLRGIPNVSQVKIYSSSGRLVKVFEQAQSQYNIPKLFPGNYIIIVQTENKELHSFKIIKK